MIRRICDRIAAFFIPHRCLLCGEIVSEADRVCEKCLSNIPRNTAYMLIPDPRRSDLYCCTAPLQYVGPVRSGILGLKFKGRRGAAAVFARYMADMQYVSGIEECDYVTAVPLSAKKCARRGFNQSEWIGRAYANYTGKTYLDGVVRKVKENQTQSSLRDMRQRMENVKGCYEVCRPELVRGRRILLIDDVYTTGATIRECARVIKGAGAALVAGLTAANAYTTKKYKK